MRIPDECVTVSSGQRVTASENRRTFIVLNPTGRIIRTVKVDDCVITDSVTPRCDYFFELGSPLEETLYVELKGKNLDRACEQLSHSLKQFADRHSEAPRRCFVVASRVPGISARTQILMDKFYRDHKVHIRFKSRQLEIKV